jgi:hypothetical protein
VQVLVAEVGCVGARKGKLACEQLVGHDAEGVDVRCGGGPLRPPPLGREVLQGPRPLVGLRGCGRLAVPGDAEVGQTPGAIDEEHVLRLEIPVHHPPVEVGQGGSDVSQHGQGLLERQGATDGLEPVTQ